MWDPGPENYEVNDIGIPSLVSRWIQDQKLT
jgi:hypothetical protein